MATQVPGSVFDSGLVLQNRYRLDEPVAVGGMAEVWRGHDLILQRQVAIKLLHPHLASDPVVVERFRREAITAARLSHPNIVPTYDAGTDDGKTYIILGFIHGPTLADVMRVRKLTPFQAAVVAEQVADALDHAHKNKLIHRDIKPANVLVVDDEHRVMVADFGIAKAVAETSDASLTLPGLVIGTPKYVAPEQLAGKDADVRSDVYSLGVLLHEMLCGHTATDVVTQLSVDATETDDSWHCRDLPKGLDEVVNHAIEPNPDHRYSTAAEIRDALAAYQQTITPTVRDQERQGSRPRIASEPKPSPTQHMAQRRPAPPGYDVAPARSGERRRIAAGIVVVLLVAGAIGLGRFVGSVGDGGTTTRTTQPVPVSLVAAHSFDPPSGDGTENEQQAASVLDGKANTTWSTSGYATRKFGVLKEGVGLTLQLSSATKVKTLEIDSPSRNWTASIYMADQAGTTLAEWGIPVATQTATTTPVAFDLQQRSVTHVLIWITDLGDTNKVTISDVRVTS